MLSFKIDLFFLISHEYIMRSVLANASSDAVILFPTGPPPATKCPLQLQDFFFCLFLSVCFALLCDPLGAAKATVWPECEAICWSMRNSSVATALEIMTSSLQPLVPVNWAGQGKVLLSPPLSVTKCLRAQSGEDPVRQSQLSTETAFHGPPLYSPALALFQEGNFMGVSFKAEYPTITCSQNADQPQQLNQLLDQD